MESWFTHQPEMTPASVRRGPSARSPTDARTTTLSLVKGDVALGGRSPSAAATFFINGVRIDSVLAPQWLTRAINYGCSARASVALRFHLV
jgi:hypothetical protein